MQRDFAIYHFRPDHGAASLKKGVLEGGNNEYLARDKSQKGLRGATTAGLDVQEAGRLSPETGAARLAEFHVLVPRQCRDRICGFEQDR